MIDHVTVQVYNANDPEWEDFFSLLGFREVPVDEPLPKETVGRWYGGLDHVRIHLIERVGQLAEDPGWSHFCVAHVGNLAFNKCLASEFVEHYNDEDDVRVWLRWDQVRVEVRR